jgi:hypothetical protein
MTKIPKKLSLVRFDVSRLPGELRRKYPFRIRKTYVFFGEIPNMPGHCVVADHKSGKLYSGYHTEHFVEIANNDA